jgi:hypothetical protein
MRAIEAKTFSGYGGLQQIELAKPQPAKDKRPEQGLIKLRTTTLNQDDEPVLVHVVNLVVLRRKDIRSSRIKR